MATIPKMPAFIKNQAVRIRTLKQDECRILINENRWETYHSNDAEVMRLVKKFRRGITRADVVALAPKGKKPTFAKLRPFFIAAMMWGCGTTDTRGPWRVREMLDDPNIKQALPRAYRQITDGDLEAARRDFAVHWCGASFYTKFFYFAGRASKNKPMPLIIDTRVMNTLKNRAKKFANKVASYELDDYGMVGEFRIRRNGYSLYVETLNTWAGQIKAKPDQLEFFLFKDD